MTDHPVLPHPFRPIRSFLSYATGDEQIEVKPEWAGVFPLPQSKPHPEAKPVMKEAESVL